VRINVRNSGPTIPKEKLRMLFEQFYRLDESRGTESGGGAGLGLAIAKEIVELHGGKITAESENESITFRVTLPVNIA
jgi:two-component system sensor histidine kinase VanS